MAVWLKARRGFSFKGMSYRVGQVFQATPIESVQMQVLRAVDLAKAPVAQPSEPIPMPTRRRRTYATKDMIASTVEHEPAPVLEHPVSSDDDQNTDLPHDED